MCFLILHFIFNFNINFHIYISILINYISILCHLTQPLSENENYTNNTSENPFYKMFSFTCLNFLIVIISFNYFYFLNNIITYYYNNNDR